MHVAVGAAVGQKPPDVVSRESVQFAKRQNRIAFEIVCAVRDGAFLERVADIVKGKLVDAGLTKFVLRPMSLADGWDTELDWLAEYALPFQN